jgi:drug/metabolite transporter (DMT)-like permease
MKKALLQINLAVILWGFTGVLGRAITLDAPVLVWYRMLLTAVFVAVLLFVRKEWMRVPRQELKAMTSAGFLIALHWVAFYGAIKLANASIALICLSTASIFTTLLDALFHKKKIDLGELGIGALALLGVMLMYLLPEWDKWINHKQVVEPLQHRNWGILCGVLAAFLSSSFTIINKTLAPKLPARLMVFYEMSTGYFFISLLLPLQFIFLPATRFVPSLQDWIWLIVLSLCCTVWAQSLALNALKHISSFTATLSVNLEPVYGIALAFFFYKENLELHASFYVGMLLIMSVLLQAIRLLKPKTASPGYIEEKGGID